MYRLSSRTRVNNNTHTWRHTRGALHPSSIGGRTTTTTITTIKNIQTLSHQQSHLHTNALPQSSLSLQYIHTPFMKRFMSSTAAATSTSTSTSTSHTTVNNTEQQQTRSTNNNTSKPTRRRQRVRRAPLKLAPNAIARIKELLKGKGEDVLGVRVGVVTKGCNGLSYTMSYAKERQKLDEEVEQDGVRLFIDNKAVMHLIGTEVDYVEDNLRAEFTFQNPNAAELCGCGKSFHPKGGNE